mmetsp:Transcript_23525/g.17990  ORF Transcript_23525/g.17990 Transcript_23525/m.17990 type:complete len:86 (+) Transcript_23525:32-289(+)
MDVQKQLIDKMISHLNSRVKSLKKVKVYSQSPLIEFGSRKYSFQQGAEIPYSQNTPSICKPHQTAFNHKNSVFIPLSMKNSMNNS